MAIEPAETRLLVEKARAGNRRAYDALIDRYSALMYGQVRGLIGDADEAHDIIQEAFLQAYLHLDTLRDATRFPTWVGSIATHLAHNWLSRYHRRHRSLERWLLRNDPPPWLDALVEVHTPESQYIRTEERWLVADTLFSLPKIDRDVLRQFYFQGLSYQEIGQSLGVSEQVVQGRLQAARDRLKGRLIEKVGELVDEVLGNRPFPTRCHTRPTIRDLPTIDIYTDAEEVLASGIPHIIKVDSVYKAWVLHMPRGGSSAFLSAPFQILHLTSPDGRHWTNRGVAFELWADPGSPRFDRYGICGICVLHDGSTYRMWYTGLMQENVSTHEQSGEQRIGYAVSPDGLEWKRIEGQETGAAVLGRGDEGTCDAEGVCSPVVLYEGDVFKMWYGAIPKDRDEHGTTRLIHIAYAESTDGVAWRKRGKVLSPGDRNSFDARWIYPGSVVRDGDMYHLWYTADDDLRRVYAIGYATSPDGIVWEKHDKVAGGTSAFDHAVCPSVVWNVHEHRMWYQTWEGLACADLDVLE